MTTLANVTHNTQAPWEVSLGWGFFSAVSKGTVASQLSSVAFPQGNFSAGPETEFTKGERWVRASGGYWSPQEELPFSVSWKASAGGLGKIYLCESEFESSIPSSAADE